MRTLLLTAVVAGFVVGAIAAVFFLRIPLTGCLDYDICLVWAVFASIVSSVVASATLNEEEYRSPLISAGIGALAGISFSLGMLVITAVFGSRCGLAYGLRFFLTLPVASSIVAGAFGSLCGVVSGRGWGAVVSVIGMLVWSLVTAAITLFGTGTFAFNPFFGYFPGPLYDEAVTIPAAFWLYRLFNLFYAVGFVGLAQVIWRSRYIEYEEWQPVLTNWSVVVAAIFGIVSLALGGLIGFRPSVARIEKVLFASLPFADGKIHYKPSPKMIRLANLLQDDLEYRTYKVSKFLDEDPPEFDAYLYSSSSQKKRLIGAGRTLYVDIQGAKIHLNPFRWPHRLLQHEVTHILSYNFGLKPLGISVRPGLIEGVAVAAEGYREEFSIHQWAKALMELKLSAPPSRIMNIGFWREAPARSYIVAGSFVAFLKEKYGTTRLKMMYPLGDFKLAYRKDLLALEDEWMDFLDKNVKMPKYLKERARAKFAKPPIFERSCAREIARIKERARRLAATSPYQAAKLLTKAHELAKGNDYIMVEAAAYLVKAGETYQAKDLMARVLRHGKLTTEQKARAKILMGDIYVLLGQHAAAMSEYRAAAKMPASPHTKARALLRIGLGSRASVLKSAMSFIKLKKLSAVTALTEDAKSGSASAPYSAYLVGDWLLDQNETDQACATLSRAANRISTRRFEIWWEAQRQFGLCQYLRGRFSSAQQAFRKMKIYARYEGERLEAQDLLDRVEWKRGRIRQK